MSKIFYDHLIITEEISRDLTALGVETNEKDKLLRIVDETLHHHVIDVILTHLPRQHHESFLQTFAKSPHDKKLLVFLQENMSVNIEEEIQKTAESVTKRFRNEIRRERKLSIRQTDRKIPGKKTGR